MSYHTTTPIDSTACIHLITVPARQESRRLEREREERKRRFRQEPQEKETVD